MKRFLQNNRYQLDRREQEEIWRAIGRRTGRGPEPARRSRRFARPAFGLTTLTAAVLLAAVWLNHQDAQEKIAEQARQPNPRIDRVENMVPATGPVEEKIPADEQLLVAELKAEEQAEPAEPAAVKPAVKQVQAPPGGKEQPVARTTSPRPTPEPGGENKKPVQRDGDLYVRGGRSEGMEFQFMVEAVPSDNMLSSSVNMDRSAGSVAARAERPVASCPSPPPVPGSVTGGTTPPNGETFELMYFQHTGVNPFVATEEDALSTFAVDVDNASYTLARSYLQRGAMPPPEAIRVEEFVNFFPAGYPQQSGKVFAIHADGAPSRFGQGYQLLRIGLKGRHVAARDRKPANLIFVIDISGSMGRENRLGLVKQSLRLLLEELGEGDRVGIVVYGSRGRILLEPTDISQRRRIESVIDGLATGGATNACEGLELAYDLARRNYDSGVVNRLILCSDGVANMGGTTRAEEMLATVRRSSDEGITLSTIGFGMGNYNDVLMEKLADMGDGNYHYVDKLPEAERVFRQNLTGLLQTIAREVKIQVEFDPRRVQRWRLLGYENRDVADRDFRNDSVDAGEVGADHEVTALYELKLVESGRTYPGILAGDEDTVDEPDLGTVRVRYEYPAHDPVRAGQVEEIQRPIRTSDLAADFGRAPVELQIQAVAAEFAEILRGSFWAKESRLADLVPLADSLARRRPGDEKVRELADLIRKAADLEPGKDHPDPEPSIRDDRD